MANTKSAAKRNRANLRRRARNQMLRSAVKTSIKKARDMVGQDPAAAGKAFAEAAREITKAATKGVLHKRNASRRISRLAKALHAGAAAAKA